jgi:hypothetical protein
MLEKLICNLIDTWNRHGNINIGFLDENGVFRGIKGFTLLPQHNTLIYRNEDGEIENSFHMKTPGNKSLVFF